MSHSRLLWTWTIRWGNPYTQPPAGQPDVLATSELLPAGPMGGSPACPAEILRQYVIGCGYGLFLSSHNPVPPRHLSLETKQRIRRQRLERRVRTKFPLFADQFIADELARRPEYFGETR